MVRYSLVWFSLLVIFPGDFSDIFGKDYTDALAFVENHVSLFEVTSSQYGADLEVVCPVLFPELIRYSQFRDFFETKGLEWAYVSSGSGAADFSIGRFQMKPSFVERLEAYTLEHEDLAFLHKEIGTHPSTNEKETRESRIERLKSLDWQLTYACVFYRVLKHKFPDRMTGEKADQIRFAAAAYNHGFGGDAEEVMIWSEKAFFPYGVHYPGTQYPFSDVSVYFFEKNFPAIFPEG